MLKIKGYKLKYNPKKLKLERIRTINKTLFLILNILLLSILIILMQWEGLNKELKAINVYNINFATKDAVAATVTNVEASPIYIVEGIKLNNNQSLVANEIINIAIKENFKFIPYLIELSYCESRLGEAVTNFNTDNVKSKDRGIFQINDYWHKDISDIQAYDNTFSTKWTINMINKGYQSRWMCDEKIRNNNINITIRKLN